MVTSVKPNRKLPARNTAVQLLILYTDPESHHAHGYRLKDGQTLRCRNPHIMRAVQSAKTA